MNKLVLAAALGTTALAAPALARDNSWYIGVDGGAWFPEDSQQSPLHHPRRDHLQEDGL